MKKFTVAVLLCALLFTLTLTYTGAVVPRAEATPAPQPAPAVQKADPKAKAASDREWNEIKLKYPRFAARHLLMNQMLNEETFVKANEDYLRFQNSGLGKWLKTHCYDPSVGYFVLCEEIDPKPLEPVKQCPKCLNSCRAPGESNGRSDFGAGSGRDCMDCLEENQRRGCF